MLPGGAAVRFGGRTALCPKRSRRIAIRAGDDLIGYKEEREKQERLVLTGAFPRGATGLAPDQA